MKKTKYFIFSIIFAAAFLFVGAAQLQADTDTTAPSAVSDLAVSTTTVSSVALTWSAPGDDGAVGTSTGYDLRYATSTITESSWASSTQAIGEPTPSVSGTSETMTVSGLLSSTTYYFALKSSDAAYNTSTLSNIVSATTKTEPVVLTENFELKVTPNTLNLDSAGNWVTVRLYLPSPYKANDVDFASLKLNGTYSPDATFRGIDNFDAGDLKGNARRFDRTSSLILKFPRANVISLAGVVSTSTAASSTTLTLTLTGTVSGQAFSAGDTIYILKSVDLDDEDNEGDLIQATSSPEVYIIKNGHRRHIPSPRAFERQGLRWQNIIQVSEQILNSFPEDILLRAEGTPEVYLIVNGMKRHIPTAKVFDSYGFDWNDVTVVTPAEIADYPVVSLIRANGDTKVYSLSGGQKHWVTSLNAFNRRGYSWDAVIIVNAQELSAIPNGTNIE